MVILYPLALVLGGCAAGPKKVTAPEVTETAVRFAPEPRISRQISEFMQLAEVQGQVDQALQGLLSLELDSPPPLAEEAAYRRAQLMLRHNYLEGVNLALELLARYPDHALAPYAHLWLAEWGSRHGDMAMVRRHTLATLKHPRLTKKAAEEAVALGLDAARQAPEWEAVQWLFAAASVNPEHASDWLRAAAERSSMSSIRRLQTMGMLGTETGRRFLQYAARYRLVTGNMEDVQTILDVLAVEAPGSPEYLRVRDWSEGIARETSLGVLLPLSGPYARYGEQALRGIRLALASISEGRGITLHVEDTASGGEGCRSAYRHLVDQGVEVVLGPLTGECVKDLIPVVSSSTPVMALTSRVELARESDALFVHTLSPIMQARFMAEYAFQQGARKLVLVHSTGKSSRNEAASFKERFEEQGGEIVYQLELSNGHIDYRDSLINLRRMTDDEALLASLDEEKALFGDEEDEIRLPVNFDSMYLALPGRTVALLAGQLVYLDISHVHLYGSSRWRDGYLLSDRGRYMSEARFSDIAFPQDHSPEIRGLLQSYREVWGEETPSRLVGLAYDSTLIVAMVTSRLGLHGFGILRGLKDETGFPGVTGHVLFDDDGIGHKLFEVFTIKRGKIVPAG